MHRWNLCATGCARFYDSDEVAAYDPALVLFWEMEGIMKILKRYKESKPASDTAEIRRKYGYHWMSLVTGELQKNIADVMRNLVFRGCDGKLIFNLIWKYDRIGF